MNLINQKINYFENQFNTALLYMYKIAPCHKIYRPLYVTVYASIRENISFKNETYEFK